MGPSADLRSLSRVVIDGALRAADPARALERHWRDPEPGPVFLAAFGKASVSMASRACDLLGPRLTSGIVIGVPERLEGASFPACVEVLAADHPLPTERNLLAARTLRARAAMFGGEHPGGTVVCVISGGGSAHLALPTGDLTLEDLRAISGALQRAGAPIGDLNTVRKHTESLKGGRLAALVQPARVDSYLLSDVVGDALDAIASGPTAPDPTTFADALGVLDRHGCTGAVPAVTRHLKWQVGNRAMETPKPGNPLFARVRHTVIANNRAAVDGVRDALAREGLTVAAVRYEAVGEAGGLGVWLARGLAADTGPRPSCIILGGEPTVRVGGARGLGGPSQELALACAVEMERLGLGDSAGVIAFSTDGVDGPTDAAGAVVGGAEIVGARTMGLDPGAFLARHDSHGFLDRVGALIRTGPSGTNVNHIVVGARLA